MAYFKRIVQIGIQARNLAQKLSKGHFLGKRRWPPKNSTWWPFFEDGCYFCQMLIISIVQTVM